MKQHVSLSIISSKPKENKGTLFSGIWLRWEALTHAERVICLGIILIPLWWVIGWTYMLLLWVVGIAIYELRSYRKIRLSRPSLEVIAIIIFAFYRALTYVLNSPEITLRDFLNPFVMWGCGGLLLWYIQSHKIRIRLQAVAWAFSAIICLMIVWWLFFHFVLSEPFFMPPRNLFAMMTDKGGYDPNELGGVSNYLVPYYLTHRGIGGLVRYTFFFPHPTVSSFAIGFAGLIAMDIKKRWWSLPIVSACAFLIIICQTRNAWLALLIVMLIRYLLKSGKTGGITFVLALFAIISFTTFSLPSVTDWMAETYSNTVEATSNFRKDSTESRNLVYQRTWERFVENPLMGHGVNGPPVESIYKFTRIGTESFVLGTLLYKSGLLGTFLFLTFFVSFVAWLYNTRDDRPLCCFMMLLYFSLASLVTEFQTPEILIILLCGMISINTTHNQL
jgi:O-Antigen ligase